MSNAWLQTTSGLAFDFLEPAAEQITIQDIAHSLATLNRFNGHTRVPYSVAEHCVRASYLVHAMPLQRMLLVHDAVEAVIGDCISPLKRLLPEYKKLENALQPIILSKFGISWPLPDPVWHFDLMMCAAEKRDLCALEPKGWGTLPDPDPVPHIEPWDSWRLTQRYWLDRVAALFPSVNIT